MSGGDVKTLETLCGDPECPKPQTHIMGVPGCKFQVIGYTLHDAKKGEEVAVGLVQPPYIEGSPPYGETPYQNLTPDGGAVGRGTGVINCLDHGFVRLVDFMGGDISIVRAARVSYDAAWRAGEDEGSDERLIRYLWKHSHTSPFEAVSLTFEVKAPIFIFRQWHRHRTWAYNELSARYRELPEEFYLPDPAKVGVQSTNNKQARLMIISEDVDGGLQRQRGDEVRDVGDHCEAAFQLYRELLEKGWPRELARSVLPVNTYSHMFASVSLLNLFRFLTLRDDAHAQYEIQVYARAMRDLAKLVAPVAVAAWEKGRDNAKDDSR